MIIDLWSKRSRVISRYLFHIFLLIGFIIFVYLNKGVAVGDRENHVPVFHFTQICYLAIITTVYCDLDFDMLFVSIKKFLTFPGILMLSLISLGVYKFTYEHAFVIADNTHYTFYI